MPTSTDHTGRPSRQRLPLGGDDEQPYQYPRLSVKRRYPQAGAGSSSVTTTITGRSVSC